MADKYVLLSPETRREIAGSFLVQREEDFYRLTLATPVDAQDTETFETARSEIKRLQDELAALDKEIKA